MSCDTLARSIEQLYYVEGAAPWDGIACQEAPEEDAEAQVSEDAEEVPASEPLASSSPICSGDGAHQVKVWG